jgi:DNA-binding transcriptional ArsR family regulator/plastocyanin
MFGARLSAGLLCAVLGTTVVSPVGADSGSESLSAFFNARGAPPPLALARRLRAALGPQALAQKILIDQPLRAVEYQLGRLTNEELVLVERKDDDVRYRPVYMALLTRKGVAAQFRDEAVTALSKMDKATRSRVLLEALSKVPADDALTTEKLLGLLLSQPAATLRTERETFTQAIAASSPPLVLRGAYGALMIGDGKPDEAWQIALKHQGHIVDLLLGVRYIPAPAAGGPDLSGLLFTPIAALVKTAETPVTRAAALDALGWTRRDAATFELLAREVAPGADDTVRAAAITSLQRIPESAWPPAAIEPLARAIVAVVSGTPPEGRTEPSALDAIQFGEKLAAKLPDEPRRAVRRDLRGLGVQVVRIETLPEKLSYDLKWFVVEAGKAVQIVLFNSDAMPHNLIVSRPGSLEAVGTAGSAMPMPSDPDAKAFVPDSPAVLYSTKLVKEGETERLGFTAPKEPGEYVYVCTFPGHWVRMYGVMLVVEKIEAYETNPTVPIDPMTKQPFTSKHH